MKIHNILANNLPFLIRAITQKIIFKNLDNISQICGVAKKIKAF